jgi:flagellar assembly factor FliW
MRVETSRFGVIEVQEEQILELPEGMIGFSDKKRYTVHEHKPGNMFKWFQSVEDGQLAFLVVEPKEFMPTYRPVMPKSDAAAIKLTKADDALLYVTVVVPKEAPAKMSANLLGPIVINAKLRLGRQVVLSAEDYSACHNILDELQRSYGASHAGSVKKV